MIVPNVRFKSQLLINNASDTLLQMDSHGIEVKMWHTDPNTPTIHNHISTAESVCLFDVYFWLDLLEDRHSENILFSEK